MNLPFGIASGNPDPDEHEWLQIERDYHQRRLNELDRLSVTATASAS